MKLPDTNEEKFLWNRGFRYVCGLDEVGRGAWAGPLVVGAVVFSPLSLPIEGVNDSKLLLPKKRKQLAEEIKKQAFSFAFGCVSAKIIDDRGVTYATQKAIRQAIRGLTIEPEFFLIDAFRLKHIAESRQKHPVKGDLRVYSIAAASIIAKVFRDNLMEELDIKYATYGWCRNKGYGTKTHQAGISEKGLCKHHRLSFVPERLIFKI